MCKAGFTTLDSYLRQPALEILPWDTDGSPCREAYNGALEEAWWAFINAVESCKKDGPSCYQTSCLIAKYAAYIAAWSAANTAYGNCGGEV